MTSPLLPRGLRRSCFALGAVINYFLARTARGGILADITIRRLDEKTAKKLRARAARHGHSIEEEARQILRSALRQINDPSDLYDAIRRRVEPLGGVDLDIQRRGGRMREPPRFE